MKEPADWLWKNRNNQIKEGRLIFTHPIYGKYVCRSFPMAVMLDTFEFNRLRSINQANLQYMVRLSATHTRALHVIDTLMLLERMFESLITNCKKLKTLEEHDINKAKKYKIYLEIALLCHDMGVPAFSHVLEPLLQNGINHEDIATSLIKGKGDLPPLIVPLVKLESTK